MVFEVPAARRREAPLNITSGQSTWRLDSCQTTFASVLLQITRVGILRPQRCTGLHAAGWEAVLGDPVVQPGHLLAHLEEGSEEAGPQHPASTLPGPQQGGWIS